MMRKNIITHSILEPVDAGVHVMNIIQFVDHILLMMFDNNNELVFQITEFLLILDNAKSSQANNKWKNEIYIIMADMVQVSVNLYAKQII